MTTANQRRIMEALHTKAIIDPAQEAAFRVQFLQDYLLSSGMNGFVLSISGGQDSALAGRLCQLAVEELRTRTGKDYLFLALRLPMEANGTKKMQSALWSLLLPTPSTSSIFGLLSIVRLLPLNKPPVFR
jgi:NH3-dependent NAD+ synthetase